MLKNIIIGSITLFVLLVLIKIFNIYYPVHITTSSISSELSVVGEGKVEVKPDTGYIDVGLTVNNAATVDEAQNSINKTSKAISEAVKKLGIPSEDIKTTNNSVYPNYNYEPGQENKITGYNGNVNVTITVRGENAADKSSAVVQAATKAGANQIQGPRFSVENPAKYREQARSEAIKNAREQAKKLEKDLGIKIGKIVNISEYSPSSPGYPVMYDKAASAGMGGGGGGPEFETGSQTVSSVVTLYFEKK
jgi:uncharacterized protein